MMVDLPRPSVPHALLAQLVERVTSNDEVSRSNRLWGKIFCDVGCGCLRCMSTQLLR